MGGGNFYRRELPRLAEVEAYGWGDNISLGLVEGGGTLDLTSAGKTPGPAFDGDIGSSYQQPTRDPLNPGANVLTIDMGGTVWLDQIRFAGGNIRGYQMPVFYRGTRCPRQAALAHDYPTRASKKCR